MSKTTKYVKELKYAEEALYLAHEVLHSAIQVLTVGNSIFNIGLFRNAGCRYLTMFAVTYVEQNRNTSSKWGGFAREGHKITWGIRKPGLPWFLCVDGKIINQPERKDFKI